MNIKDLMSANSRKSTGKRVKTQAISLLRFVQVMDSIRLTNNFREMLLNATRIGLPIGVYWFCYAVSPETAIQEADGVCAPFVIIELIILSAMILNRRPPLMLSEKVSLSLRLLQNNSFFLQSY